MRLELRVNSGKDRERQTTGGGGDSGWLPGGEDFIRYSQAGH